jgi:Ca-activated chloride channel family protein
MSRFIGVFVLLGVTGGLTALWSEEPAKTTDGKAKEAKAEEKTDILKDVQGWNSDKFAGPPTQFREGHVKARKLAPEACKKTESGFVVSLPSNAPIPTPTVYQGNLYVSGGFHSREFYCLKADTGAFVWGMDLDDDGPTSAVCDQDAVAFNTESCTLFVLDAKTGKQLWSYFLGDPLTSTPTIANGVLFTSYPAAGGGGQLQQNNGPAKGQKKPQENAQAKAAPPCSHVLAAFELKTGKILWQRWIDSDVMTAPVAVDKELYCTSFAGVVYKFNQADGKILSANKSRATCAPTVVGQNIYLTRRTDDGKGNAKEAIAGVDRDSQKQRFQAGEREAPHIDPKVQKDAKMAGQAKALDAGNGFGGGAPAAANPGAAFGNVGQGNVSSMQAFQGSRLLNLNGRNFNCMGDEVVCTDPESGKNLWSHKLKGDLKKEGGYLAAPPVAAGGMLFLTTLQGDVLQMDPKEGKVVKTYKVGHETRFQPVVEAGRIYVGTQDGKVVCVDTGNKAFTGWSCWGANPAHTGIVKDGK